MTTLVVPRPSRFRTSQQEYVVAQRIRTTEHVEAVPFAWLWYSGGYRYDYPYLWSKVHLVEGSYGDEGSQVRCGLWVPYFDDDVAEIVEGAAAYRAAEPCRRCHKYLYGDDWPERLSYLRDEERLERALGAT